MGPAIFNIIEKNQNLNKAKNVIKQHHKRITSNEKYIERKNKFIDVSDKVKQESVRVYSKSKERLQKIL